MRFTPPQVAPLHAYSIGAERFSKEKENDINSAETTRNPHRPNRQFA